MADEILKFDNQMVNGLIEQLNARQAAGLTFPEGYCVSKELTAAYLELKQAMTRDHKPIFEACTQVSVARALLDMATLGLSAQRKQGYFIAYGNKCIFQRSYFGNIAIAKRCGLKEIHAEVIYDGDEFEYEIRDGIKRIAKHIQDLKNINPAKIIGAYAVATMVTGEIYTEIENMAQIRKSWEMGATRGGSPAHKNFPDEMAKKTVINRTLKLIANASPEGWFTATDAYSNSEAISTELATEQEITEHANKDIIDIPEEAVKAVENQPESDDIGDLPPEGKKAENEANSADKTDDEEMGF
jgi:recombination protein RecT